MPSLTCDFGHQLKEDGHHLHSYIPCPPNVNTIMEPKLPMEIMKVEIDKAWYVPLLRITTYDGSYHFYYRDKNNGTLILGQPYTIIHPPYTISLFLPIPKESSYPFVLDIKEYHEH